MVMDGQSEEVESKQVDTTQMVIRKIRYADPWPTNLHWTEDPVRPELSREFRHTAGREVYTNGGAVICVAYCNDVPKTVDDLTTMVGLNHAIFYTVWSRKAGHGRSTMSVIAYMLMHLINDITTDQVESAVEGLILVATMSRPYVNMNTKQVAGLIKFAYKYKCKKTIPADLDTVAAKIYQRTQVYKKVVMQALS